jgi:hypothetical protein
MERGVLQCSISADVTHTFTGNFTAAGEATVKLIELNQGQAQFKRKSYISRLQSEVHCLISICTSGCITADLHWNSISMDAIPHYSAEVTVVGAAIKFTGTTFSLSLDTELSNFKLQMKVWMEAMYAVAAATLLQSISWIWKRRSSFSVREEPSRRSLILQSYYAAEHSAFLH